MPTTEEVLTIKEVAEILRCSKTHVCNVISGKIRRLPPLPVVRIGRRAVVRRSALMEWLKIAER
jgi:excisionase family DNA binding protein